MKLKRHRSIGSESSSATANSHRAAKTAAAAAANATASSELDVSADATTVAVAESCFERVRRELTVPLYPWQLDEPNAEALVLELLRSRLHRHDAEELGGILHAIEAVRLLADEVPDAADGRRLLALPIVDCGPTLVQFPVRIRLTCRLFRPRPGVSLACRVTAALPELLSCVCHGVYQVTVVGVPPDAGAFAPGDRVLARVTRVRTHTRLQVSLEAEFVAPLPPASCGRADAACLDNEDDNDSGL